MSEWRIESYLTIDKQGRVVIPKEVREKLGLAEGSRLKFIARSNDDKVMTLRKCE